METAKEKTWEAEKSWIFSLLCVAWIWKLRQGSVGGMTNIPLHSSKRESSLRSRGYVCRTNTSFNERNNRTLVSTKKTAGTTIIYLKAEVSTPPWGQKRIQKISAILRGDEPACFSNANLFWTPLERRGVLKHHHLLAQFFFLKTVFKNVGNRNLTSKPPSGIFKDIQVTKMCEDRTATYGNSL